MKSFYKNVNVDKFDTHVGNQDGVVVTIKRGKPSPLFWQIRGILWHFNKIHN